MITENAANEVRRDALLARVARARPRIVALVAPAGFGKSTLARQLCEDRPDVIDCAAVRDDLDLARALAPAAAGDGSASVARRVSAALESWCASGPGTTVFENAERAGGSPSARAFLWQLLAALPEGRRAILCSRADLRVHLARRSAPHEVLVLRAGDLAFDQRETRELCEAHGAGSAVAGVAARTRGWPAAVQLLLRSQEYESDATRDYIAEHVLAPLDRAALDALLACAVVPGARLPEIRALFPAAGVPVALQRFVEETAFVERDADGRYSVHPLIAAEVLRGHDDAKAALLSRLAVDRERAEEFERAAELHVVRGDTDEAARVLARVRASLDRAPTPSYAAVLRALDRSQIARYPRLWGVGRLRRMYCDDSSRLLDEAESMWRMMSPAADAADRMQVFVQRALLQSATGAVEAAVAAIAEFERDETWMPYLRALLDAQMGKLAEAERGFASVLPAIASMDAPASGAYLSLGAAVARVRGERALEVQYLDRAAELANRSGLENIEAVAIAEAAFGAWFAGDEDAFAAAASRLARAVENGGVYGLTFLSGAVNGSAGQPRAGDAPKYTALGALIAASSVARLGDALRYASLALEAARASASPFVECIAEIAVGLCDRAQFDASMERALVLAVRCDSRPLRDAAEALAERRERQGMLEAFAMRFSAERRRGRAPLELEFASGAVRVSGRTVHLSAREAELLFALALRRDATPRIRLAVMLWPELSDDAGRNALSVCLHRLRGHLGKEAVKRDGDGYRLRGDAGVDLWTVEETLAKIPATGTLDAGDRAALASCARALAPDRAARMDEWEWFAPVSRRLDAMRTDVTYRLGADALARGECAEALARAHEIITRDPLDEPARELAIRASLALGDRAAATRHYRQYRDLLQTELKCEPAAALTKLVYP